MSLLTGASLLALAKFICYSSIYSTLGTRVFFSSASGCFVSSDAGRHVFGQRPMTETLKPLMKASGTQDRYIFRIFMFFPNKLAFGGQTYFRSSLLSLHYFSEGEKRRPEIRLRFAGY